MTTSYTLTETFSIGHARRDVSRVAGDMRLMISDFRQNPKKFLHVKLTIF